MIQCSNPACQVENTVGSAVCRSCQTPIVHRFLWVIGDASFDYAVGTMLAKQFQVWGDRILLDTRPALFPPAPANVPASVIAYLRLAALPLQIPRPYTVLTGSELASPLLLLEDAPLALQFADGGQLSVSPLPSLSSRWAEATPLRQLNWLRQIAALWTPLAQEGVEASLLVPHLLRVDSSVLRLLALHKAGQERPTLADLGRQWQAWLPTAHAAVRTYLAGLVTQLLNGSLKTAPDLLGVLEQAVADLAQAQPIHLQTVTFTDQGPTRARNEDACYPLSGTHTQGVVPKGQLSQTPSDLAPMVIVCDGIGGHESGDVASHLAIQVLQQALAPLGQQPHLSPTTIATQITEAIIAANDAIAQRNDQEQRQARGRMGTTLVMALVYPPYLFIAHLGDSRAYRISNQACCQITLDDDVASRETRLGYAFYRQALQSPGAGSLVQALGIGESAYLYPTVQSFLLDDESVFLLCSDGLSDYERVEAFWPTALRPAITGQLPVAQLGQQLVKLANTYNGHDNVTVGVIVLSPQSALTFPTLSGAVATQPTSDAIATAPVATAPITTATAARDFEQQPTVLQSSAKTRLQTPPKKHRSKSQLLLRLAILLPLLVGLAWWVSQSLKPPQAVRSLQLSRFKARPFWQTAVSPTTAVTVGSFWQANRSTAAGNPSEASLLTLQPVPEIPTTVSAQQNAPLVPAGSILKVISRRTTPDNLQWVLLQVCSIPSGLSLAEIPQETDASTPTEAASEPPASLAVRLSQPGNEGWILEPQFTLVAAVMSEVTPTQKGSCP